MDSNLFLYCVVMFVATMAGGLITLVRKWSDDWLHLFLSLGAGIFLGAVFFHLLPEAMEQEVSQGSGVYMGSGIGECSSLENKYAWRVAVCDEEFNDTPENMRRIHYKKGYQGSAATKVNQVRQDMHTLANTILKMAKKRSLIDAVMNVTACSDIFDQDVDESHIKEAVMGDTPEPPKKEPVRITAAIIVKAMSGSKDLKELDEKLKKSNTTEFANDPTITAAYEKRKAELNA